MPRPKPITLVILALLAATSLGCSLIGRAVDTATGGAASTLQAVQAELEEALATLPAEMGGALPTLPVELPGLEGGAPSQGTGAVISGSLSYPSEAIPPLRVVAFDVMSKAPAASVDTEAGQSSYALSVPNGMYYVVAYTLDGSLAGGYTIAVLCGLTAECTDHSLLPVPAASGLPAEDINPADWYAPEDTFPPAP